MGTVIRPGRTPGGEDRSLGHRNGDPCPRRCGGMITIREAQAGELVGGKYKVTAPTKYAQCSRCYWNTF